jgi:hypothetical protein
LRGSRRGGGRRMTHSFGSGGSVFTGRAGNRLPLNASASKPCRLTCPTYSAPCSQLGLRMPQLAHKPQPHTSNRRTCKALRPPHLPNIFCPLQPVGAQDAKACIQSQTLNPSALKPLLPPHLPDILSPLQPVGAQDAAARLCAAAVAALAQAWENQVPAAVHAPQNKR